MQTLFDDGLTPEAIKIINENPVLVNRHIGEWVSNQKKVNSDIAQKAITLLSVVKRKHNASAKTLACTPERARKINKLVKRGFDMKHFKGVIEYIVPEWTGTAMAKNLYPETIFAVENFQKYLEQAREDYKEKNGLKTPEKNEDVGQDVYSNFRKD